MPAEFAPLKSGNTPLSGEKGCRGTFRHHAAIPGFTLPRSACAEWRGFKPQDLAYFPGSTPIILCDSRIVAS